jgi:hypothetical protein
MSISLTNKTYCHARYDNRAKSKKKAGPLLKHGQGLAPQPIRWVSEEPLKKDENAHACDRGHSSRQTQTASKRSADGSPKKHRQQNGHRHIEGIARHLTRTR